MNLFDNKIYIIDVKVNGLKINLKIGVSIQCFRRRPQQVHLCTLHCDVECFDWPTKTTNNVYFQSCQLMFCGLTMYKIIHFTNAHSTLIISFVQNVYSHTQYLCYFKAVWLYFFFFDVEFINFNETPLHGIYYKPWIFNVQ